MGEKSKAGGKKLGRRERENEVKGVTDTGGDFYYPLSGKTTPNGFSLTPLPLLPSLRGFIAANYLYLNFGQANPWQSYPLPLSFSQSYPQQSLFVKEKGQNFFKGEPI